MALDLSAEPDTEEEGLCDTTLSEAQKPSSSQAFVECVEAPDTSVVPESLLSSSQNVPPLFELNAAIETLQDECLLGQLEKELHTSMGGTEWETWGTANSLCSTTTKTSNDVFSQMRTGFEGISQQMHDQPPPLQWQLPPVLSAVVPRSHCFRPNCARQLHITRSHDLWLDEAVVRDIFVSYNSAARPILWKKPKCRQLLRTTLLLVSQAGAIVFVSV